MSLDQATTPADREFLEALVRAGRTGKMPNDLAAILGCSEAAVRARASRLGANGAGFIEAERSGGFVFYSLTDAGRRARG